MFTFLTKDRFFSLIIPILIMLFVQTNSMLILFIALALSLFNINRPFVLFPTMFITSLSTTYFMIIPGLSFGLVYVLLMIISLAYQRDFKTPKNDFVLFWIVLLTVFNLIECITSITGSMASFYIMSQCFLILYFLSSLKGIDIHDLIFKLSAASIACLMLILSSYFMGAMVITDEGRYTVGEVNENSFAMILCQLSMVVMFSFFYFKNKIHKTFALASFLAAIFLILISGSRSAFFGAIIGAFVLIICFEINYGNFKKKIIPLIFLGVSLYVGIDFLFKTDLPVLERFQIENIVESRGSGRLDRRDYLLSNVFPQHPVLGVGLGGANEYAVSPGPCHNIILDPLIQIGIVGIILYWFFIFILMKRIPRIMRRDERLILPMSLFVAAFINGMGEIIFFEKFFWNAIAMCVLFANNTRISSSEVR